MSVYFYLIKQSLMKTFTILWIISTILLVGWCSSISSYKQWLSWWWDCMTNNSCMNMNNQEIATNETGEQAPSAVPTEIVTLKDGDIYDMTVSKVMKEVGNTLLPMLSYNGSIPWPLLKIEKWATVTIRFTNKIKGIETLLHSHGVRVDNTMDWVAKSMWGKQDPIGYWETFEYTLTFPDEWIFRYHPHIQEELQQELWLYGNYLISDQTNNKTFDREETLIVDDILLEDQKIPWFLKQGTNYSLMWRYGNIMLINGSSNYNLTVEQGEVVRLYLTNVSNTRPYRITIPWVRMKLVGSDIGYYEHEEIIDNLIIWPAERYIVDIVATNKGNYVINNQTPKKTTKLGSITVWEKTKQASFLSEFDTLHNNTWTIDDIKPFRSLIGTPIQKTLRMSIDMKEMKWMSMDHKSMMWSTSSPIEWEDDMEMMNKHSTSATTKRKLIDEQTNKENMDINWSFTVWDKAIIRISNDKESEHPMQHPMHFHGQRFLVISKNGVEQNNLVWKDTVLIPAWEYVDIILDASNPGVWMAHCHIAEHLSAGMMMNFEVKNNGRQE